MPELFFINSSKCLDGKPFKANRLRIIKHWIFRSGILNQQIKNNSDQKMDEKYFFFRVIREISLKYQ